MDIFSTEKLTQSTTRISILHNVNCFLVEGSKEAVLLDCGIGLGDLKGLVETLTDKPIRVILTHGHVDHIGNASTFEEVYLHERDWELTKIHDAMERKIIYASMILKEKFNEDVKNGLCSARSTGYLPLHDGQLFDLGGVTLEIIEFPGHTYGSVCVLNREERWILFGDMVSHCVYLWSEESTSVEEYLDNAQHLKLYEDCYDTVYLSHGPLTADKSILDGVIEVCQELIKGNTDAVPYPFRDFEGLKKAKATDRYLIREDGGIGNIIYRENKIFR